MWIHEVYVEDGKYSVSAQIIRCGKDVSLTIGGGETPHIGASALAIPRPSLSDPETVSASTSVICVPGHKEDEVARTAAERIAASQNCAASVCAGVHVDNASQEELLRLKQNLDKLIDLVLEKLEESCCDKHCIKPFPQYSQPNHLPVRVSQYKPKQRQKNL